MQDFSRRNPGGVPPTPPHHNPGSDRKDPAHHRIAFPGKPWIDLTNSAFDKIAGNSCNLVEFYHGFPFKAGACKSRVIEREKKIGIRKIFRDP